MQGIKNYIPFISFWILNSTLILLASVILPKNFELGSSTIPVSLAHFWSGAWLTFVVWMSKPILTRLGVKLQGSFQLFVYYWFTNSVVIWILARFAEYSGFGISKFYWAVILGFIVNLAQWNLWQVLKRFKIVSS